MKKFNILFSEGLWGHIVIGFEDGSFKCATSDEINQSQNLLSNLDETIKIVRTSMSPPVFGSTTYEGLHFSRAPRPTLRELRAFSIGQIAYDITFLADFIAEDRCWFVVGDHPALTLSRENQAGG